MSTKKSDTRLFLEKLTGGPVTLGKMFGLKTFNYYVRFAEFLESVFNLQKLLS